jgi:hypothetical protein
VKRFWPVACLLEVVWFAERAYALLTTPLIEPAEEE